MRTQDNEQYLKYIMRQDNISSAIANIKAGIMVKYEIEGALTARDEAIVKDVVNEFLIYTNRDEIPETAYGLLEDMAIKRLKQHDDATNEHESNYIKSVTQGNISITYKDNVTKYDLTDSEKKLLNRFKISKATKYAKRRS